MLRKMTFAMVGLALAAGATPASAQWSFSVTPYVWWSGLNGDARVGGGPVVELDSDSSDFDFVPMLTFRGTSGTWGFLTDLAFTPGSVTGRVLDNAFIVDVDNFIGTALVTYDVTPAGGSEVFVAGGLRILDASASIPSFDGEPASEGGKTWVDPVFGLGAKYGTSVLFNLYGDLGGFGISSDFTYQLYGTVGYAFTRVVSARAGYRLVRNNSQDSGEFLYEVTQGGFLLGVTFVF